MRGRIIILCCIVCLIVLSLNYTDGTAKSKPQADTNVKVGAVDIRKVFEGSKKNADYKERTEAEQKRIIAELDKLRAEIEAEKAGLNTLKTGSTEHMAQVKAVLTKQANYNAQQEFHTQEIALKERRWIVKIYKDVLRIAGDIAEQRGLDLILENSEPELTDMSAESLVVIIRTNKLLYSGGCVDITDEVIARLDASK